MRTGEMERFREAVRRAYALEARARGARSEKRYLEASAALEVALEDVRKAYREALDAGWCETSILTFAIPGLILPLAPPPAAPAPEEA